MKNFFRILSMFVFGVGNSVMAQNNNPAKYSGEGIMPQTHIVSITKDSIIVVSGKTYSFTVDTPEDSGLISTTPGVKQFLQQLTAFSDNIQNCLVTTNNGISKEDGELVAGDKLIVKDPYGKIKKTYPIGLRQQAVSGSLRLRKYVITSNNTTDLIIYYTIGQRTPDASVKIDIPAGIEINPAECFVNVIGRGDIALNKLATQSLGRVGSNYPYKKVGEVNIVRSTGGGYTLSFTGLDLRASNGADLTITLKSIRIKKVGKYAFKAVYTTAKPQVLTSSGTGPESALLTCTKTISDLERIPATRWTNEQDDYTTVHFKWGLNNANASAQLMQSLDSGRTWTRTVADIDLKKSVASVSGLAPGKLYEFRLLIGKGDNTGFSNSIRFYSGMVNVKDLGVNGEENSDNTDAINNAIRYLHDIGGGTLFFGKGNYAVRTVHLKTNVWLYVEKGATIRAMKGGDAPEPTWFSDKKYRSGLSPTDPGPYADPENYMTKQDVGHHYFRNTMFFAEREDNIKIIGNGYITGNGNLVTGDRVMNNAPDNRSDKMFTFKLCTNIEIGGLYRPEDLWYDAEKDEPYYIRKDGSKDTNTDNMLHIDRSGHFALLATGSDNIHVHDTYFGKLNTSNVRDIYDFMGCNNVTAINIYSRVSSDDIIKPGSDCSLGFTRPARNYKVRNIIGDTNCNLFQIGSETADDIMDIHVDNIYVLGANKAGFSISTNDGAHIKDIHLNCGHTGTIHSRSKMYRTFAPFFISISNRARIIGAEAGKYAFTDNGLKHNELLIKNVNIGQVENIILNGIDVYEVYAGSSFSGNRWKAYDGTQRRATPIIAGYSLPDTEAVAGGLDFKLPNGKHTGYISNIEFNDVHVLLKGGNPVSDTSKIPPELGVGQYNVSNLNIQPSYGIWARHVKQLSLNNCSFNYEKPDGRYAIFLDDVLGAKISNVKMVRATDNDYVIKLNNSGAIVIDNTVYFTNKWNNLPAELPKIDYSFTKGNMAFPSKRDVKKLK